MDDRYSVILASNRDTIKFKNAFDDFIPSRSATTSQGFPIVQSFVIKGLIEEGCSSNFNNYE